MTHVAVQFVPTRGLQPMDPTEWPSGWPARKDWNGPIPAKGDIVEIRSGSNRLIARGTVVAVKWIVGRTNYVDIRVMIF